MPELPEVHTTVEGIKKLALGKTIKSIWSDFHVATAHGHRNNLKNKKHYENFKKLARGAKIKSAERKGKNILIHLSNDTSIVVHMKMTGHLMYSGYNQKDPFNGHIHFKINFTDDKELVLSDTRKFASVCLVDTKNLSTHEGLKDLGEDALEIKFNDFKKVLVGTGKHRPIKNVLLDQEIVAGIGNIYSDEILWKTDAHPLSPANKIPEQKIKEIYKEMRRILKFSISKGGDSKSDYRNIFGEKGGFQNFHKAYGNRGKKCPKPGCPGIIERIVVKGRSSHFCPVHQKLYK